MRQPTWTIKWTDEMSVVIPDIDEDHKHFIILIHDLNRTIADRKDSAEIKRILQLIIEDAERHFAKEEKLFQEWNYPDLSLHAASHAQTLNALQGAKENCVPYGYDSSWIDAGLKIKKHFNRPHPK